ncbi:hypothetical protein MAR_002651, partial [Mya arenaria]
TDIGLNEDKRSEYGRNRQSRETTMATAPKGPLYTPHVVLTLGKTFFAIRISTIFKRFNTNDVNVPI